MYCVVALSAEVPVEPLVASDPLQPPEAVQEVALADDQVNVDLVPLLTVLGFADKVTVGTGAVTVIAKLESAAVDGPSLTLMTILASVPALPAAGVPERVPVCELNCSPRRPIRDRVGQRGAGRRHDGGPEAVELPNLGCCHR